MFDLWLVPVTQHVPLGLITSDDCPLGLTSCPGLSAERPCRGRGSDSCPGIQAWFWTSLLHWRRGWYEKDEWQQGVIPKPVAVPGSSCSTSPSLLHLRSCPEGCDLSPSAASQHWRHVSSSSAKKPACCLKSFPGTQASFVSVTTLQRQWIPGLSQIKLVPGVMQGSVLAPALSRREQ